MKRLLILCLVIATCAVPVTFAQPGYVITTAAGNGQTGSGGDGGLATAASVASPFDVAFDAAGNMYIAQNGNHVISKVTPNGVISTFAGNGFCSPVNENVSATQSAVCFPAGLAFDKDGNLYVTSKLGNRIRMITPQGIIRTIAGTGASGFSGDNGPALQATFNLPTGIVVDDAGNVYVSDNFNNRVRKITNGTITTVVGTGGSFFNGDGGAATLATVWLPEGLALDAAGSLYIADAFNGRVRKVTGGLISTVAGGNSFNDVADGGLATKAVLSVPTGVTFDANGNLIVTERDGARIRQVTPQGAIYKVAGTGVSGYSGDGGGALQAKLFYPHFLRAYGGSIYFGDEGNNRVRRLNPAPSLTVSPQSVSFPVDGGVNYLAITSVVGGWTATTDANWIVINGVSSAAGTGSVQFTVSPNASSGSRSAVINVGSQAATILQDGTLFTSSVRFVPVTPCRVFDSRADGGKSGLFGPPILAAGGSRDIPVPSGSCNIPVTAKAYSVNVTAVPNGPLSYLTLWPTGQDRPTVSTLNSFAGKVVANAALVPAGAGGSISVFVTDATHAIIDINGYFTDVAASNALPFFTLNPCRVVETRPFRPVGPLGGPSLTGGVPRDFPLLSGSCNIPQAAKAYSLNVTAVPPGPLSFLTFWPSGVAQPLASTLNSFDGRVVANAALVPAGLNGTVTAYATNNTDVVVDINGYFGPAAANALSFSPVTPCRVVDTRDGAGTTGDFGPPVMAATSMRVFPIPNGRCSIPASAQAYSLNITVVPRGILPFLTIWPAGQPQPVVSTLNSFDGSVVANAALVPAGVSGGVSVYVQNTADVIIDINGYFAP